MRGRSGNRLEQARALIASIAVAAILCAGGPATGNAGHKSRPLGPREKRVRIQELVRVDQLREVFRSDSGKVRLIALLSPT
jgi:hypothetical protein